MGRQIVDGDLQARLATSTSKSKKNINIVAVLIVAKLWIVLLDDTVEKSCLFLIKYDAIP